MSNLINTFAAVDDVDDTLYIYFLSKQGLKSYSAMIAQVNWNRSKVLKHKFFHHFYDLLEIPDAYLINNSDLGLVVNYKYNFYYNQYCDGEI